MTGYADNFWEIRVVKWVDVNVSVESNKLLESIMKSNWQAQLFLFSLAFLFVGQNALVSRELEKHFKDVASVKIKTVSGDCIVSKNDENEVAVIVTYDYEDGEFEPRLEQRGRRLFLRERFASGSSSGRIVWRVRVPEGTDIEFSTSSGDLEVTGLASDLTAGTSSGNIELTDMNGKIKLGTASGDIRAKGVTGELDFGTASGNIVVVGASGRLKIGTASGRTTARNVEGRMQFGAASGDISIVRASGDFKVGAASGDIDADEITISDASEFDAASGDIELKLGKSPDHDLKVAAASGDVLLDFNNQSIRGRIVVTARARGDRIQSPFEFDDTVYFEERGQDYVTKIARKGSGPKIELRSDSGKAVIMSK